eukprot:g27270.t1
MITSWFQLTCSTMKSVDSWLWKQVNQSIEHIYIQGDWIPVAFISLATLILYNINIGNAGATAIAKALQVNNSIRSINLNANDIGDEGAKAIGLALQVNNTVQTLDLDGNKIGPDGAKAISKALEVNSTSPLSILAGTTSDHKVRSQYQMLSRSIQRCKC